MSTAAGQSVGIDVSEQSLDVHLHPAGLERRLPYTADGMTSLIELLKGYAIDRVVLESTGGLQRRLERSLRDAKYPVTVVNPERIWAYRRLVGRAAKTDRGDARLIAEAIPENIPGVGELTAQLLAIELPELVVWTRSRSPRWPALPRIRWRAVNRSVRLTFGAVSASPPEAVLVLMNTLVARGHVWDPSRAT